MKRRKTSGDDIFYEIILHKIWQFSRKKIENQCAYKPGSVLLSKQKRLSFIYYYPHEQSLATYPLTSDGQPYMRQYTWSCNPWREQTLHVTMQAVSSYLTFSPLPKWAVIFFFTYLPSRIASTFRNTVSYIARTFLFFCPQGKTSDKPSH